MPPSSASVMPSPSAWAQNNRNVVKVHCAACDTDIGTFENSWLRLTKSYMMPEKPGSQYRTAVRGPGRQVPTNGQTATIEGCFIAEASCRQCNSIFGHQCMDSGRTGKEELTGRIFYKQHKIYLSNPDTQEEVHAKINASIPRSRPPQRDLHERRVNQAHSLRGLSPDSLLAPTSYKTPSQRGSGSRSVSSTIADHGKTSDACFSKMLQHEVQLEGISRIMEDLKMEMQQVRDMVTNLKRSEAAKDNHASSTSIFATKLDAVMRAVQNGGGEEVKILKTENQTLRQRLEALTSSLSSALSRRPASSPSQYTMQEVGEGNDISITGKRKRASKPDLHTAALSNGQFPAQETARMNNIITTNGFSHSLQTDHQDVDGPEFSDEELQNIEPNRASNLQTPIVRSDLSPAAGDEMDNDQHIARDVLEVDNPEVDSDYRPQRPRRRGRPPGRPPGRPRNSAKKAKIEQERRGAADNSSDIGDSSTLPSTARKANNSSETIGQKTSDPGIENVADDLPTASAESNHASSPNALRLASASRRNRTRPTMDVHVEKTTTAASIDQSSDAPNATSSSGPPQHAHAPSPQASESDLSDPPSSPKGPEIEVRRIRSTGLRKRGENGQVRKSISGAGGSNGDNSAVGGDAKRRRTQTGQAAVDEEQQTQTPSQRAKMAERERLVKETMEREEGGMMTEDD